ncbi:MAG: ATP-binding protein, partial [Actinobacteria bacterium]|nr:ATP-binding protein [Actinomycetota bacterium]
MGVSQPIRWVYGNLVYAKDLCDAWAIFEVETSSYDCLSAERKVGLFSDVRRFVSAIDADFQLMRVASGWDHERFADELAGSQRGPRADVHARYVDAHRRHLSTIGSAQPSVWVAVRLKEPDQDIATYISRVFSRPPRRMLGELAGMVNLQPARDLVVEELERHRVEADQAHARIEDTLACRAATGAEVQWLIRRGFCRSRGEPEVDGLDEPAALVFERNGKAVLRPVDADVLRWMDGHIRRHHNRLEITSELGVSHQTGLVCGALPELSFAPSRRLELLFAPPESLEFAIDMTFNARYLPNGLAASMVRRRIQDADQVASAEAEGDQGVSDVGAERMGLARDLLRMLQGSGTPPLLQATTAVQISAPDPEELERRVERTRRAFGDTKLHRPVGYDQLELFCQQMPGQPSRVSGYEAPMTPLQLAAMAPTAAHKVGSSHGFYLGHTVNLARQPVVFNLREGSDIDRATGILKLGSLGRGKTIGTQKLYHEAFAQNARIIDVDPKGDHTFHLLDEVAPFTEVIDLKQAKRYRGILDPLRIGVGDVHQTAAVTFLRELLPIRSTAEWETSILQAVNAVCSRSGEPSLWEVIRALTDGDQIDRQVAKTLEVHATSSFAQLGFHDRDRPLPAVGEAQVTY